ncbi:MAG: metal-dependent transcriptional regulator [Clostridia bacterium]|nr:metal-dependent transcriptional regulator [Clostridia bacterium]
MSLHESGQMYLEAIYVLSGQRPVVRSIDVGEYLGYSKPSVSRAMSILKKTGYVIAEADGALKLTQSGREVAQTMYARHTVLTKMLIAIGVDEDIAAEDACRIEHVISEETFDAIKKHMEWAENK